MPVGLKHRFVHTLLKKQPRQRLPGLLSFAYHPRRQINRLIWASSGHLDLRMSWLHVYLEDATPVFLVPIKETRMRERLSMTRATVLPAAGIAALTLVLATNAHAQPCPSTTGPDVIVGDIQSATTSGGCSPSY